MLEKHGVVASPPFTRVGIDLIKVLEHNQIPWITAEREVCCGMPKLEQGDLEAVDRLKRINIPRLVELARQGFAIMSPVPSCTLMFKFPSAFTGWYAKSRLTKKLIN